MDPMKILLVDDSKSARYALRLQLQRHGVDVDTAESAESAFELLKGALPDAIFMDHTMPGMNGFEALEVIREDPRTAHLPVVMCTSHEDADFVAAAHRKGVVDILPKSVAPEKLPNILARLRGERVPAPAAPTPAQEPAERPVLAAARPPSAQASGRSSGLTEAEAASLIDGQITARLDRRLDQRIEASINALLGDLRRDLTERLMSETRSLLDTRLAEERRAREASGPSVDHSALDALTARLTTETLPDLVKIEIEAERGQIMDLVEQYLREFAPRQGEPHEHGEFRADRLAGLEGSIVSKAKEAARRESAQIVESALDRTNQVADALDALTQQVRSSLTHVYLMVAASAVVGIGAAAVVYLLLR